MQRGRGLLCPQQEPSLPLGQQKKILDAIGFEPTSLQISNRVKSAWSRQLRDSNTPKWRQENPALDLLYLSRPWDLGGWAVVGWNIRYEFMVVQFFESSEKPLDLTTSIWGPGRPAQAVSTPGSVHSREHRHPREAFETTNVEHTYLAVDL